MKTAVSLPDKVFRQAESFARRSKKTRSRLYAEALAEYLARHAPDDITESMNKVCDLVGTDPDAFSSKAARSLITPVEW
jgi:metal-responsive CopG/Arc/MetJ family transcriptional regulator